MTEKETILLRNLKNDISTLNSENDPFNDRDLFNQQVTAYFLAEKAPITIDHKKKSRFRVLVRTKMFGGKAKHLDILEYERQKERINSLTTK